MSNAKVRHRRRRRKKRQARILSQCWDLILESYRLDSKSEVTTITAQEQLDELLGGGRFSIASLTAEPQVWVLETRDRIFSG